jgi:hypothetical protein
MALEDIGDYFSQWDQKSFEVYACGDTAPTEAEIAAFEATTGFRLPDEFRDFTMSKLGGLYMAVREELWPRPQAYQVAPAWSFTYGFKVFGIASDIPDWLDIRAQYKALSDLGAPDLVPFFQLECDADYYGFDRSGRIVQWDHEQPDLREPQDTSFSDFLMSEIHQLETRRDRKLRGEDKRPTT